MMSKNLILLLFLLLNAPFDERSETESSSSMAQSFCDSDSDNGPPTDPGLIDSDSENGPPTDPGRVIHVHQEQPARFFRDEFMMIGAAGAYLIEQNQTRSLFVFSIQDLARAHRQEVVSRIFRARVSYEDPLIKKFDDDIGTISFTNPFVAQVE